MPQPLRYLLLASLALNLALGASLTWLAFKPGHAPHQTHAREPRPMFHPEAVRRVESMRAARKGKPSPRRGKSGA